MLSQERLEANISGRLRSVRLWTSDAKRLLEQAVAASEEGHPSIVVAGYLDEADRHLDAARQHFAKVQAMEAVRDAR